VERSKAPYILLFDSDRSISTNDIRSHKLSDFFHLTIHSSQFNDRKIKNQTHCHLFSYRKREMRDGDKEERNKKDKRNQNQNLAISTSNDHNF
jgi:hypothetical protein